MLMMEQSACEVSSDAAVHGTARRKDGEDVRVLDCPCVLLIDSR